MLAELRGKLGRGGDQADERLEDLLTSNVLGALRYLPLGLGLLPVLGQVQSPDAPGHRGALPIDLDRIRQVQWFFWPRTGGVGEVDVLLLLLEEDGTTHGLLVEAKYRSGKSGGPVEEDEDQADQANAIKTGDQLARYLLALRDGRFAEVGKRPLATRALIYLTAHGALPRAAMEESQKEADRLKLADPFFWLSWREVDRALRPLLGQGSPETQNLHLDLLVFLKKRRLAAFHGFRLPPAAPTGRFRVSTKKRWAPPASVPLPASWRVMPRTEASPSND